MSLAEQPELADLVSAVLHDRLAQRTDLHDPGWQFWERRNLNMHRVVGLWSLGRSPAPDELCTEARSTIASHFRCAWWRGLGFGVVVELPEPLPAVELCQGLVDLRENSKGTWQWLVLVSSTRGSAWGIHTWAEGFLSPVYRELLARLDAGGCELTSVRVEKDGLLRVLTALSRRPIPEFRNELPRGPRSLGA